MNSIHKREIEVSPVNASVYACTSSEFLEHALTFHQSERVSMLIVSLFVSESLAQLAKVYSDLLQSSIIKEDYKTFFNNSYDEAIHAAIKLCRHKAYENSRKPTLKKIAFLGDYHFFQKWLHAGLGGDCEFTTGITFYDSIEALLNASLSDEVHSVVVQAEPVTSSDEVKAEKRRLNKLRSVCKKNNIAFGLDESRIELKAQLLLSKQVEPDFILLGESAVDYQAPFGALIMSSEMYKPWDDPQMCFLHSSTFGGNNLILSFAIERLKKAGRLSEALRYKLDQIETDFESRLAATARYINPQGTKLYRLLGLDVNVKSAKRLTLKLNSGEDILDCTGNYGCSLRGHNHDAIATHVLQSHSQDKDYWALLCKKISELTGFNVALPSVSGASAVDNAILAARMANPNKQYIVTFNKNYSGKTLLSMSLSQYASAATWADSTVFAPYSDNVIYVDPHASDAVEQLVKVLSKGNICLVWFEVVQGFDCLPIPQDILDIVDSYRETNGYLVGTDDVLAGVWRTGRFLSYQGKINKPDIVTLAKSLSDMFFPIGMTLLSQSVAASAQQNQPELYNKLASRYVNQLGSHIAYQGLEDLSSRLNESQITQTYAQFRTGLETAISKSKVFSAVRGEGGLIKLVLNQTYFPSAKARKMLFEPVVSNMLITHANLLIFMSRLNMPRDMTESEIAVVTERLKHALEHQISVKRVWINTFKLLFKLCLPLKTPTESNKAFYRGKRILITGATSGIGLSLAMKLSELGAHLVLIGRREFDKKSMNMLRKNTKCLFIQADICDESARKDIYEKTMQQFHGIDIVINNAGMSLRKSVLSMSSVQAHDADRTAQVNYIAAVEMTQLFLAQMIEQGGGQIVNSQSIVTNYPSPMFACYAASKQALKAYMGTLSVENMGNNIRVTDLNLPLVATPMSMATNAYGNDALLSVEQVLPQILDGIRKQKRTVYFDRSASVADKLTSMLPESTERLIGTKYTVDMNRLLGRKNPPFKEAVEKVITKLTCRADR
ncbi:SDR family NAD(P)-dependent oxidoreductase [Pseudoalteromonas sp. Isolate6]|uniref:SDR family NAD(P)-dependent oxidoreductase n=1 Tax=Pseudoalteromonas sp. Isolate6 TaxID=2908527 RepID=UPI001EFC65A9|nr:SDR family NAD(P)-dependent oxidoreductase [Pseudoalteromonas sp. Isolate6]